MDANQGCREKFLLGGGRDIRETKSEENKYLLYEAAKAQMKISEH